MKINVGGIDKILRIAVGLALIAWALVGGPVWALSLIHISEPTRPY